MASLTILRGFHGDFGENWRARAGSFPPGGSLRLSFFDGIVKVFSSQWAGKTNVSTIVDAGITKAEISKKMMDSGKNMFLKNSGR